MLAMNWLQDSDSSDFDNLGVPYGGHRRAEVMSRRQKGPGNSGSARKRRSLSSQGTNDSVTPRGSQYSDSKESLREMEVEEHYQVLRTLGTGTYGEVVLARCVFSDTQVALKVMPKTQNSLKEVTREFNYNYFLSPHSAVINIYDASFETVDSFVLVQEHAPRGDLLECIPPEVGLPEAAAKAVAFQIGSALEFMHSKNIVHRDVKPENVLVFDIDFHKVKLTDFGMTRRAGTMVRRSDRTIPYTPPEIADAVRNERCNVTVSSDVWSLGVMLFCALTGTFPWENAHISDAYFDEYIKWFKRKTVKNPSQWTRFSERFLKLARKILEPKPNLRAPVTEIKKHLDFRWMKERKVADTEVGGEESPCDAGLENLGVDTECNGHTKKERLSQWLQQLQLQDTDHMATRASPEKLRQSSEKVGAVNDCTEKFVSSNGAKKNGFHPNGQVEYQGYVTGL